MLKRLEKHLEKKFGFLKDRKILIAVSGGIDSIVLTHLMHQLSYDCTLAHCNFNLRGTESDSDEAFVITLSKQLNLPVETIQFETLSYAEENKISIQMAARNLRYKWFQELTKKHHLDYIFTAHQKDDVLETFLINFTRGTGLDGLTGIPEINENIIRPLLIFDRNDIATYASENNIDWREDLSNSSTKYFRNKIRHQIVPILKELNPNLLKSFDKTLINLKESQTLVQDRIRNLKNHVTTFEENDTIKISVKKILELNNPKAHLYELLKPYNFTAWKDVVNLLTAQTGKKLYSSTHRLVKSRDELILTKNTENSENSFLIFENTSQIQNPISLKISETKSSEGFNENTAFLDKSLLKFPITVRKWEKGDYFYPIGMHGKKKLSKYFKDEKMSLIEKEQIWLLCSDHEIVWVIGRRLDNRYKTTNKTSTILKVQLQ